MPRSVSVCRAIRRQGSSRHAAILMLTARREESDKVVGLESGADDYSRHERMSQERGVTLSASVGVSADTVHADADRLEQALQNLAANAIRHSNKDDRVTLESAIASESVVLRVRDTGEGIAAEHVPRVFDRFYKADASRGGAGSGLGLSIVKAIVERHGGTIAVTSDPGRETVFEIRLPR